MFLKQLHPSERTKVSEKRRKSIKSSEVTQKLRQSVINRFFSGECFKWKNIHSEKCRIDKKIDFVLPKHSGEGSRKEFIK